MKLRQLLDILGQTATKIDVPMPFICGGTPRDRYMGHLENISDLDLTTGDSTVFYLSQEFAIQLKRQYQITRTIADDNHSTIFIGNLKMDFSSNFNVAGIDTILHQKGIKNPTSMQKEMYSRDFTCNALLLSLDLKNLIDTTKQGFPDIKKKVIRTCLDANITLTANRNRVIRAIYLAAKLDFDLDSKIIEFVSKNPQSVKISTDKTLKDKLSEAFIKDPDKSSYLITKMGLWNYLPITQQIYPYYLKANVHAQ